MFIYICISSTRLTYFVRFISYTDIGKASILTTWKCNIHFMSGRCFETLLHHNYHFICQIMKYAAPTPHITEHGIHVLFIIYAKKVNCSILPNCMFFQPICPTKCMQFVIRRICMNATRTGRSVLLEIFFKFYLLCCKECMVYTHLRLCVSVYATKCECACMQIICT